MPLLLRSSGFSGDENSRNNIDLNTIITGPSVTIFLSEFIPFKITVYPALVKTLSKMAPVYSIIHFHICRKDDETKSKSASERKIVDSKFVITNVDTKESYSDFLECLSKMHSFSKKASDAVGQLCGYNVNVYYFDGKRKILIDNAQAYIYIVRSLVESSSLDRLY